MLIYSVTEVRKNWKLIIEAVEKQRLPIYIKRYNRIVAVIIPIDEVSSLNPANVDMKSS